MLANHNAIEDGGYVIERSLRFMAASSQYLTITFGTALSGQTLTVSMWVKRGTLGTRQTLFGANNGTNTSFGIEFSSSDQLDFYAYSMAYQARKLSSRVFRDPSAWYHIVCVQDTTNATASDRFRVYVNGERLTAFVASTDPGLNQVLASASFTTVVIGREASTGSAPIDGGLAEFHVADTQALNQANFGETNHTTGQWVAKKYIGTYSTNGFYLDFKDGTSTTTLGYDKSGNNNHWTLTNFTRSAGVNDCWMRDVPAGNSSASAVQPSGNYAVLNPLKTTTAPSRGNLSFIGVSGSYVDTIYGSVPVKSAGKYYWEITGAYVVGVNNQDINPVADQSIGRLVYHGGIGSILSGSSSVQSGLPTVTSTGIVGVAIDLDNSEIKFYKNNVQVGTAVTITAMDNWFPFFQNSNGYVSHINFGQRSFAYTPPTGFKALCTANLPAPSIIKPSNHFNVQLSTGANIKTDSEALFTNELEWIKDRANANNHQLIDSVRGSNAVLQSNTTVAQTTYTAPSGSSVGWVWRASDSATVTNNVGSISSQVSANPTAGFSIVTYTGNGVNATVGHGLGIAPKMVIVKNRSQGAASYHWFVYHASTGANNRNLLNTTGATAPDAAAWNNTAPTSSVFSVGTAAQVNENTSSHVAYCFAEIAGYSKFGSYTGNGSANGPFVYTGFRPRFVMIKRTDAVSNWLVFDTSCNPVNAINKYFNADTTAAEGTFTIGDVTSSGFKLRNTDIGNNASGGTYIYMAFAETPFNYANTR